MRANIYDFLPEKISDESAYHLVSFFIKLTEELESVYYAQMKRHVSDSKPTKSPKHPTKVFAF